MKGKVTKWALSKGVGIITDENREKYIVYRSDFINGRNLNVGNKVRFDAQISSSGKKRAVNVVRTGHGRRHPFAHNLRYFIRKIENGEFADATIRKSTIKRLSAIGRYFCEVEDVERYDNVEHIIQELKNGEYEDAAACESIIEQLSAMERYFCEVEDAEWCHDIEGRFCSKRNDKDAKKSEEKSEIETDGA